MYPSYLKLYKNGELRNRIDILKKHHDECALCPHICKVNRNHGEKGVCRSGVIPVVASYNSHHGEEPPISGISGSGTIFFTGCSGRCIFCQNYPINQLGTGSEVSEEQLAGMMIELQKRGCININLVTPTHFLPSIIKEIYIGVKSGLCIPIVYNTNGYERVEIIRLLDGIIDIYLPDAKYSDNNIAKELSGFNNYVENNRSAIIEMFCQVGNLQTRNNNAVRGLIVRHLILPENLGGTGDILKFLSEKISKEIYVSLMDQYFPAYNALKHKKISRKITLEEYNNTIDSFYDNGLYKGWIQEHKMIY